MLTPDSLALLEQSVGCFYGGSQSQIAEADRALDGFRAHPQPCALLDHLVRARASTPVVLWGIALAEQWLTRRWRHLPPEERQACRGAVVGLVMASVTGGERVVSLKLQHLLAVVLKADWPAGWQSFIPDLLAAPLPPADALRILLLLAEECFAASPPSRAAAVAAAVRLHAAPLVSLCAAEVVSAAAARDSERLRTPLALLGRCAAYLPAAVGMPPHVLALLPPLVRQYRPARVAALTLLHEYCAVRLGGGDEAAAAALHAALADVVAWAEETPPASLQPAERLALLLLLRAACFAQRAARCAAAGGRELLGRAVRLLCRCLSAADEAEETLAACVEAAAELARDDGGVDGVAEARGAALRLLCGRMPRPAHALVWAEGGEGEVEVEEGAADDEADGREAELARRARLAAAELLRAGGGGGEAGEHLLRRMSAGLAAADGKGCGEACTACWALLAALDAGAAGVGARALDGLLGVAACGGGGGAVAAACAALLLREHAAALVGLEASDEAAVLARLGAAVRALCGWALGHPTAAVGRMAGAALREMGRTAALGPAFIAGEPPLLLQLLQALTPSLDSARPHEAGLLDVHAALAATIGACVSRGDLHPSGCHAAIDCLATHASRRLEAAISQLAAPPAAIDPSALLSARGVAACKEACTSLRLLTQIVLPLTAAAGAAAAPAVDSLLSRLLPSVLSLTHAATAALAQLLSAASAAGYAHALATKEARALRALRTAALELCGGGAACGLAAPPLALAAALLPSFAHEPPALRPPQLLRLCAAAGGALDAAAAAQLLARLLAPALAAAQALAADAAAEAAAAAAALGGAACELLAAWAARHAAAVRGEAPAAAAALAWCLGGGAPHALDRRLALAAAHAALRAAALPEGAAGELRPLMRRALAALPDAADVRAVCARLGVAEGGGRAAMHARVLGLTDAEFAALREDGSEEAEAEADVLDAE